MKRVFPSRAWIFALALATAPAFALQRTEAMRQLVQFGLRNSPRTKILFLESKISFYEYKRSLAQLFPEWRSQFNYESLTYPSVLSTDVTGAGNNLIDETAHYWSSGLFQKLPTETDVFVQFQTDRVASNSVNVLLSPYYFSSLKFGGRQPLLKGMDWFGGGLGDTWTRVRIAQEAQRGGSLEMERSLSELVQNLEGAYLDFSFLKQKMIAYENTIGVTQKQLDFVRGKIRAGLYVEADAFQVEERLEARKVDLLEAKKEFDRAQSVLMHLLGIDSGHEEFIAALGYELPQFDDVTYVDPKDFVRKALANNKEIQAERKRTEVAKLEAGRLRSRRLPLLDVSGAYVLHGGNSTDARGYSSDLAQLTDTETDGWEIGVNLTVPLGPPVDRYEERKAFIQYRKQQETLRNVENQLSTDILQDIRNASQDKELYYATQKVLALAQKKLAFEQKKFEGGLSTNFQVLTYQEDWTDAFVNHLRALTGYHRSQSRLDFLMGKLLADYAIVVEKESLRHEEN